MEGKRWAWFPDPERCWGGLTNFVGLGSYDDFSRYYRTPDDVYELVGEMHRTFNCRTVHGHSHKNTGTYVRLHGVRGHVLYLPKDVVYILNTPVISARLELSQVTRRLSRICASAVLAMR